MALHIEQEDTLRDAAKSSFNLFLGSGFSIHCKNANNLDLPLGNGLRDMVADHFLVPHLKSLSLSQICTVLQRTKRAELEEFLRRTFTVTTHDPRYDILKELSLSAVFTTNIDNLIPNVFASSQTHYLNDVLVNGPAFADRVAVDYIPLHGSVMHPEGFTFSPIEISSSFTEDRAKWGYLIQRLERTPTVFCGYRMEDAGVLASLNPALSGGRARKSRWILLHDSSSAERDYFSALGFNLITGSTLEFLEWLATQRPVAITVETTTKNLPRSLVVDSYRVPALAAVPVRTIRDFYLGSAPSWSDIFSNRIPKTSHFGAVSEAIHSKRDVAVLGLFASGKSTLMMQLASEFSFAGTKLVCSSLTLERAKLLTRTINDHPTLIFMDDFTDHMAAFNHLASVPNIQVVGFERNYAYDNVSHLVDGKNLRVVECTELNEEDLQTLFESIPPELRRPSLITPSTNEGVKPSLFEIVETNMIQPTLRQQAGKMLVDLEKSNPLQHDFFVMCCYVHECRTPVSYDMAHAFLSSNVSSYEQVYEQVTSLDKLVLTNADVELLDTEQDYFVPRSSLVSRAVVESVAATPFKRVLLNFKERLSPLRISHYDVFKRKAFDERFVSRAFVDTSEGLRYYEDLIKSDESPFLYQQAALYLMRRKRYKDAFLWIDKAIELSRNRIPSIRNSFADILFRANIGLAHSKDPVVIRTLKESMDILNQCYMYDKRKNYHALRFGEQAIQYWNVMEDADAKQYLSTASKWLKEETRRSPWHRDTRRLLVKVSALV